MSDLVYLNGEILPAADARIGVYDGAFLHGAGLFETMRADGGRVFRLDHHLDRLLNSADKLGLPVERPDLPLTRDFENLLEQLGLKAARVRLTVSVGTMHGDKAREGKPDLNVCLTAAPLPPYPEELRHRGMSVLIAAFRQSAHDPLAGHKTVNYLPRLLALRNARQMQCAEALWFTTGNHLAEGCISNVFLVRGTRLATPPVNTPVLPGIARGVVLEIAREHEIEADEETLNINDLLDADEVFLTNSTMQVMPVCRVEKKEIGTGRPGPLSAKLRAWFQEKTLAECQAGGIGR